MSNPITESWTTYKITCQMCNQTQEVQADPDRIARPHNGGLGYWICGKSHNDCWTKLFGSDETDDYGIGDSQM